ncbi:MAG TPA: DUF4350 domain-containing protein [Kofleriaceae bacterium]|nr:DUF4350 domain-containing protein [Kofleriaceae bacterium]
MTAGETGAAPQAAFSRTAGTLVAIAIGVSLVGAILLTVFLDDITGRPSSSSDGYSVSAIGHHGIVEILEELDVPVVVSRHGSGAKAKGGVLVIAEPVVPPDDDEAAKKFHDLVASADTVLVVLPKWYGAPKRDNRRWLEDVAALDAEEVSAVLRALGSDDEVIRISPPEQPENETDALGVGALDFRVSPDFVTAQVVETDDEVSQTVGGKAVVYQVWGSDLETDIYILSDPDLVNNAGLTRGNNARFAVRLLNSLRGDGPVVFDETLHGFAEEPSLWKAIFRFPLVLITLHVTLLMVVVVWAGLGRFGPARGAPPALAAGKEYLVRNTAALLRVAGHHSHALERYFASAIEAVRIELHAPRDLAASALPGWLERVRAARGGTIPFPELRDQVAEAVRTRNARAVLAAADRVHRWRQEMTHGPQHHS